MNLKLKQYQKMSKFVDLALHPANVTAPGPQAAGLISVGRRDFRPCVSRDIPRSTSSSPAPPAMEQYRKQNSGRSASVVRPVAVFTVTGGRSYGHHWP